VLDVVRRKLTRDFHDHDFQDPLDGLAADLVNEAAYSDAASAGIGAVPGAAEHIATNTADVWIGHVRKYANLVPGRIAGALAESANDAQPDEAIDDVLQRISEKMEALRSSVNRYGEPPWGAGNQGYGEALGAADVLIDWQLGSDDPCSDCVDLASGSPYAKGDVPTWPKAGDTQCFDNCYCSIVADEDSWNAVFGGDDS
jgi:hypothetical protein